MSAASDLLFEIGCEELPASFVDGAVRAMPELLSKRLRQLRLEHGGIRAFGTPRRLTLWVTALQLAQDDLEEEVTGPPVRAAFKDGAPTKAAEAFARKLGCSIDVLQRVDTPKGEYLQGTRREEGRASAELLPQALSALVSEIPFRKSMRWGSGSLAFGRPIRWLLCLLGEEQLAVSVEGVQSSSTSFGHRFLHPGAVEIAAPGAYLTSMRAAHVVVDPQERASLMKQRLAEAARHAGGVLIEDEFLVGENLSLAEDPQVVVGSFDPAFLELPEEVILEVARGHQRYFGLRDERGSLLPKYLAVVNTAQEPEVIAQGNDRVMRARLADARFFYREDLKKQLAERKPELKGIVFQNKLGSVLDKVERIERLVVELGTLLSVDAGVVTTAVRGAALAKCDLVTWMVGEFPELQGEVGAAYAAAQDEAAEVAVVIRDHYKPKGAADDPPDSLAAALVSLADRVDTLVGCFAIGLSPTGATDPYALRRACITTLRILLAHGLDVSLEAVFRAAYGGFDASVLDLDADGLCGKLGEFVRDRLRGVLAADLPQDAVSAALGVAADRPVDALARATSVAGLDAETRARVGEVFKRANNIAKDAPDGDPTPGEENHEKRLHEQFFALRGDLVADTEARAYDRAFGRVAELAPTLAAYFDNVFVMSDDEALRNNRLRLMRAISESCRSLAQLELLAR